MGEVSGIKFQGLRIRKTNIVIRSLRLSCPLVPCLIPLVPVFYALA